MVVAYCSFCPKMPQKASKRGLLAQKSGGLLEFQSSVGLIKSGLLFARIRYEKVRENTQTHDLVWFHEIFTKNFVKMISRKISWKWFHGKISFQAYHAHYAKKW